MSDTPATDRTPDGDHTANQLLAELADDFAARYRRGKHPRVEAYAQQHPALADQIRELFPAMLLMEQSGSGPAGFGPTVGLTPAVERPGTVIGRYKLLERLGEGGMGVVFTAEQQHPMRRRVALKVIKPGMDTWQVIARFEAERQALAMMDHPGIARVFDAGATESGRPYFVMELVPGVPITNYCDNAKLGPRERLGLFVQVCHAVQHAHQKGVIHRDLKPNNVLVTVHDDKPVPKVIDFGVAKAAGQDLTERTLFTQFAQMVGTPLYMSPEQAQVGGLDIDTRSDVYSLGVLLYELLTGTTPFDRQRLGRAAFDEVRRIIREEEPPKPSTRLSTAAKVPSLPALRGTELRRLSGQVRGELDCIVMRCLEKDRTRRYETASGLAADVGRYLAYEPIIARPVGPLRRAAKWARRRPAVVTSLAGGALVTLALAGSALWLVVERATAARAVGDDLREVARFHRASAWPEANAALDRAISRLGGRGPAELRARLERAGRDADLAPRLDAIRAACAGGYRGVATTDVTDRDYLAAFGDAGLLVLEGDPADVAARVGDSDIQPAVIAGLDNWSQCTADPARRAWLLDVARRADHDPTGWRGRVRDPAAWGDGAALAALLADAPVADQPVSFLLAAAQQLNLNGRDPTPFLATVQRAHPGDFWANLMLGRAMYEAGNHHEAIRFAQAAVALRPDAGVAHEHLGDALAGAGRPDDAIAELRVALRLDPRSVRARGSLGATLTAAGRHEEAARELEASPRRLPE